MALEAETLNPIVESVDARQMAGREQLARGAGQWFVTERMFPAPHELHVFQDMQAALRQAIQTAHRGLCPTYVLQPCACDWRDCSRHPRNCNGPTTTPTVRRCGCRRPCGCMRVGARRLRRIAATMADGRVYYRTRHGTYRLVNAPLAGRMKSAVIHPGVIQGEIAAKLYAGSDPMLVGRPTFGCDDFDQDCFDKARVPVVYVDPGGLRQRYDDRVSSQTTVERVGPVAFRQLIAASHGGGGDWL
jgi:hypothetical protein